MEKVLIVIPARYGSSRLPGKPLVKIKGIEMIKRVSDIADFVCRKNESCSYLVARSDRYMEKGEGGCPYRLGLVGMERIRSITGDEKGNPLFRHDGIGGSAGICLSFLETNHTRYP